MLTYYKLYQAHQVADELDLDISCVGGIVDADQALQALLLGASTVQLSSAIAWNGIAAFQSFNDRLRKYFLEKNIDRVEELRGSALSHILCSADEAAAYFKPAEKRRVTDRCKACEVCFCTDKLCIAISQSKPSIQPKIDEALCSGCGWCEAICPNHAIGRSKVTSFCCYRGRIRTKHCSNKLNLFFD